MQKFIAASAIWGVCSLAPYLQAVTGDNLNMYFDMGEFYGAYLEGNWNYYFTNTTPTQFETDNLNTCLSSLFTNLQATGVTEINMSFAQLVDINSLYAGTGRKNSASDPIAAIMADNFTIDANGTIWPNLVAYMIYYAHNLPTLVPGLNAMRVDLSIGGQDATVGDTAIIPLGDTSTTAASQALKLVEFLQSYGFDSVDFDIEGNTLNELFVINTPAQVLNFFETVHAEASKRGILCVGTFLGALGPPGGQGPEGTLAPLCQNFSQLFDGVNLMLYGAAGQQYYLDWDNSDASGVNWGINQWLEFVKDPKALHIGFYDRISYTNPSSSAGYAWPITQSTDGAQAGYIYETLLSNLTVPLTPADFGQPFWWTDLPQCMVSPPAPAPTSCVYPRGPNPPAQNFFQYLQSH